MNDVVADKRDDLHENGFASMYFMWRGKMYPQSMCVYVTNVDQMVKDVLHNGKIAQLKKGHDYLLNCA